MEILNKTKTPKNYFFGVLRMISNFFIESTFLDYVY